MEDIKIPKTTKDKPYIEFTFNKKGNMQLSATSDWWGGIREGFCCSNGTEGNTCLPKDLDRYIKAFKKRKITSIQNEIKLLQIKLRKLEVNQ